MLVKVVNSLYSRLEVDESGVESSGGVERGLKWWQDIFDNVSGEGGKWMWGDLEHRVGNGGNTSFWNCQWTNSLSLKRLLSRLF